MPSVIQQCVNLRVARVPSKRVSENKLALSSNSKLLPRPPQPKALPKHLRPTLSSLVLLDYGVEIGKHMGRLGEDYGDVRGFLGNHQI